MSSYPKPNDILTCPYNKAHQVERSRMQFHLEKCRKQHPNEQKVKCPFDATHIINHAELDYHILKCDKRNMLDVHKYVVDDGVMFQPTAAPPLPVQASENWDDEDVESYKPDPKSHVIKKVKGATPSERRRLRCEGIRTYKPNQ